MKRTLPVVIMALVVGFVAGRSTAPGGQPVISGRLDDLSFVQSAMAQAPQQQTRNDDYVHDYGQSGM